MNNSLFRSFILLIMTTMVCCLVYYICFSAQIMRKSTSVKLLITFGIYSIGSIVLAAKSQSITQSMVVEKLSNFFLMLGVIILCIVILVGIMFILFPDLA